MTLVLFFVAGMITLSGVFLGLFEPDKPTVAQGCYTVAICLLLAYLALKIEKLIEELKEK